MPVKDTIYNKARIVKGNSGNPFLYFGDKPYSVFAKEKQEAYSKDCTDVSEYQKTGIPLEENDYISWMLDFRNKQVYSIGSRAQRDGLLPSHLRQLQTQEAFDYGTINKERNELDEVQPYIQNPFSFGDHKGLQQQEIPNYKYKTDEEFYDANPQLGLSYEYLQQVGARKDPKTGKLIQPDRLGIYFPNKRVGTIPFLTQLGLTDWMAKDNKRNYDAYNEELNRLHGLSIEGVSGLEGVELKTLDNGDKILFFRKDLKDADGNELAYKLLTAIPVESFLYNLTNVNQTMVYGYDSNGNIINKNDEKDPQAIERFGNFVLSSLAARLGAKGLNKIFGKGLSKIGGVFNKKLNKTLEKTADKAKNKTIKNKAADWWYNRQTKTIKQNTRGIGFEIEVIPGSTPYLFNKPSIGTTLAIAAGIPLGTATYDDIMGHEEGDITSLTDEAAFDDLNYRIAGHNMDMRRIISMKHIYEDARNYKEKLDSEKRIYSSGVNTIQYTDDYIDRLYQQYEDIKNTPGVTQKILDDRWNNLQKAIHDHIFGGNVEGGVVNRCKSLGWQPNTFYIEENGSLRPVKDQNEWEKLRKEFNLSTAQDPVFNGLYISGDILGPDITFSAKDGTNKHLVVDNIFTDEIKTKIFSDNKAYGSFVASKFDENKNSDMNLPFSNVRFERHDNKLTIIKGDGSFETVDYDKNIIKKETTKDALKGSLYGILNKVYKVSGNVNDGDLLIMGYATIFNHYKIPIKYNEDGTIDNDYLTKLISTYLHPDENNLTSTERNTYYEMKEIESFFLNTRALLKAGAENTYRKK